MGRMAALLLLIPAAVLGYAIGKLALRAGRPVITVDLEEEAPEIQKKVSQDQDKTADPTGK
jgi:hypothetical protein